VKAGEEGDGSAKSFIEEVESLPEWVRAGTGIEDLVRDVKELMIEEEVAVSNS
jgi:hypothetical protein